MLTEWTTPFINAKDEYVQWLKDEHGAKGYRHMLQKALEIIERDGDLNYGETPDPNRITVADYGSYQGTLVFVIGATGYQPWCHWSVVVGYGSCGGCDFDWRLG